MWDRVWGAVKGLFSGSSTGKSIIQQTADIVDNYNPGEVTKHKMQLEDTKAADDSQADARKFQATKQGNGWFDTLVDGLNRLPRPLFAFWSFGILSGIVQPPAQLSTMNAIELNIIWSVVGFYFGIRTITQDLPKLVLAVRGNMK